MREGWTDRNSRRSLASKNDKDEIEEYEEEDVNYPKCGSDAHYIEDEHNIELVQRHRRRYDFRFEGKRRKYKCEEGHIFYL